MPLAQKVGPPISTITSSAADTGRSCKRREAACTVRCSSRRCRNRSGGSRRLSPLIEDSRYVCPCGIGACTATGTSGASTSCRPGPAPAQPQLEEARVVAAPPQCVIHTAPSTVPRQIAPPRCAMMRRAGQAVCSRCARTGKLTSPIRSSTRASPLRANPAQNRGGAIRGPVDPRSASLISRAGTAPTMARSSRAASERNRRPTVAERLDQSLHRCAADLVAVEAALPNVSRRNVRVARPRRR